MTVPSDLTPELQAELASYLGFLADHELDLIYSETPNNLRLAENKSPIRAPLRVQAVGAIVAEVSASVNALQPQTLRDFDLEAALTRASALIGKARTLAALYEGLEGFADIPLRREGGRRMVPGRGAENCDIMVIIDPPGQAEDESGQAASGPQGRMLDQMLKAAGLADKAYITHAAFWKPVGQGPLNEADIALHHLFLKAMVRLSGARGVFLMGACAARTLLGTTEGIMKLRNQLQSLEMSDQTAAPAPPLPVMVSFAPGFLMRQPQAKAMVWADLLRLKKALMRPDN